MREGVIPQASHITSRRHRADRQDKCIGCQFCVMSCPYGVRYLNEEEGVVEVHAVPAAHGSGRKTAPVRGPVRFARFFGDLDEGLESFRPWRHPRSGDPTRR